MRLVVDREIRGAPAVFERFGEVRLVSGRTVERGDLAHADVLFVRSVTRVNEALLEGTPVKFVGTATAGTDHLDLPYLRERGTTTFAAGGCNARAVAEYVLACALLESPLTERPPQALRIGIVGYGNVGKAVAKLFTALGVECVINDPPMARMSDDVPFADLDAALDCDIVSVHVPLTTSGAFATRNLLGTAELERVRDGALLLNAARGGVIDEAALLDWTSTRPVPLAIDCWVGEPAIDSAVLRRATIATPHIAGHTIEARLRAAAMLCTELARQIGDASPPQAAANEHADLDIAFSGNDCLANVRAAVLACCDPRIATGKLRATLELDAAARAAAFDQLRRDAAGRREFGHYRIASTALPPDTVERLSALGFHTN